MEVAYLAFLKALLKDYIMTTNFNSQFVAKPSEKYLQYSVNNVFVWNCLVDSPIPLVTPSQMQKDLDSMKDCLNLQIPKIFNDFRNLYTAKERQYVGVCRQIREVVNRCNLRGQDYVDVIELEHLQRVAYTCEADLYYLRQFLNRDKYPMVKNISKSWCDKRFLVIEFS